MKNHKKMVHKTWQNVFYFHNLAAILFLTLVVVIVVYLRRDTNLNVVKEQINLEKDQQITDCDYFSGQWVYDDVWHPLYKESQCPFIDDDRNACEKYGRKDLKYQHWRWQPHHCDIPRFNGKALLEKLKGKKVYFVGDSLNRNQWMSMLCLIDPFLPPSTKKEIHLTGNWHLFQQIEYNMTIGFYWSPYLVESNCDDQWHYMLGERVIKVNAIEKHARHWNDADILIFDSYAWWLTISKGSFGNYDSTYVLTDKKRLRRYEMALSSWSDWLEINVNRTKTKLFFMGASPFPGVDDSRQCYNKSEPIPKEEYSGPSNRDMIRMPESIIQTLAARGLKVQYLRITEMSDLRKDAHTSIYRKFYPIKGTKGNKKDRTANIDCVHWCLPGVPDTWNEILYAYIMNS